MLTEFTYIAMRDFDGTYTRLEIFSGRFSESMGVLIERRANELHLDPMSVEILRVVYRGRYKGRIFDVVSGPKGHFFAVNGTPSVFQAWGCPLDVEANARNFIDSLPRVA